MTTCVICLEKSSGKRDLDGNACHTGSVDDGGSECTIAPPGG